MTETFTDFMIRMMAGEENVRKAVVVFQSNTGVACEQWTADPDNQSKTDLLGLLRFAQLGVEHDLQEMWKDVTD